MLQRSNMYILVKITHQCNNLWEIYSPIRGEDHNSTQWHFASITFTQQKCIYFSANRTNLRTFCFSGQFWLQQKRTPFCLIFIIISSRVAHFPVRLCKPPVWKGGEGWQCTLRIYRLCGLSPPPLPAAYKCVVCCYRQSWVSESVSSNNVGQKVDQPTRGCGGRGSWR